MRQHVERAGEFAPRRRRRQERSHDRETQLRPVVVNRFRRVCLPLATSLGLRELYEAPDSVGDDRSVRVLPEHRFALPFPAEPVVTAR